eukprot:6134530-Amphidinium_carterae.1
MRLASGRLKLRLSHFVPFLDACMRIDESVSCERVAASNALSVHGQKVRQSKHVHVKFHDGLSACRD